MASSQPPSQSQTTTPSSPILTNSTGKSNIIPSATLLASVFHTDPALTYLLHSLSAKERREYMQPYFVTLMKAASLNDAIFTSVQGESSEEWKSVGVLMPPGKKVDNTWTLLPAGMLGILWNIGFGGCHRMLGEFGPLSEACKTKGLKGRKDYYYVFFLGTSTTARGQGLCSKVVRSYQELAGKDNKPLWLEGTTEYSMKLYAKLGFEMVDEIVLGKGKVGADGLPKKDGEGVKIWGMVWWPKKEDAQVAES